MMLPSYFWHKELIKIIILVIAFISNIFLQIYLWLPNLTSGGNTFVFFQYIRFSKNQIIRVNLKYAYDISDLSL